ncbi:hypothetical protein HZS_7287 [Henneguya salminicola]|nr:hypothetical protein HZS_7287 [Henneguya salminicola]
MYENGTEMYAPIIYALLTGNNEDFYKVDGLLFSFNASNIEKLRHFIKIELVLLVQIRDITEALS